MVYDAVHLRWYFAERVPRFSSTAHFIISSFAAVAAAQENRSGGRGFGTHTHTHRRKKNEEKTKSHHSVWQ